jgi:hypothetical protein
VELRVQVTREVKRMTEKTETSENKAGEYGVVQSCVMRVGWKGKQPTYGPNYVVGKVGKWKIFSIHKSVIKGEHFILRICLPGIKESQPIETEASGKKEAERILNYWLKGLHA